MDSSSRPRLLAGAAVLLLALAGASQHFGLAKTNARTSGGDGAATRQKPAEQPTALKAPPPRSSNLILGSADGGQPENMEQFLTAVIEDVDNYWTKVLEDSGLPEPRVSYMWIPAGQTAASACGDEDGSFGDSAAAYCAGDDTIYISQKFATDIYNGALDQVLPGSSQGYGRTVGDFSVAYIVAHEYGHEVQDELGVLQNEGTQLPAMALELQADCYAGTWAKSAADENRLEDGDVQEALDAALAVGDFDTSNPGHHGTPEQREEAWTTGFQSGDPSACSKYLDAASVDDGGGPMQIDGGAVAK